MDGVNLVEQSFAVNAVKSSNSVSDSKNDVLFSDYMAKPVLDEKESVKSADTKDSRTEYQQYKYKKKDIEPSDKTPEKIKLDEIKTKKVAAMLSALNAPAKALIVTNEKNDNVVKSAKNIEGVTTTFMGSINVYDILKHDVMVVTKDAVAKIEEVYA